MSQIILHPVMDLIFKKDKKGTKNLSQQQTNMHVDKLQKQKNMKEESSKVTNK